MSRLATQLFTRFVALSGLLGLALAAPAQSLLPVPARASFQAGYCQLRQPLRELRVRVTKPGPPAVLDDESYRLRVYADSLSLTAPTSLGALRGQATLRQLLAQGRLPLCDIQDQPRFRWRGLLMDPARHFLPVSVIKRNLDGMAAVKLNVLHWHLCDDQGWRVESRLFPRLHTVGGATGYYTQDEVREVVRYAATLGIRVVPEFDLPGHAGALIAAYPRLASRPDSSTALPTRWGVLNIAIDPTRESTYTMLDSLLTEMSALFPDPYLHLGGDENNGRQWRSNPRIVEFMKAKGFVKANGQVDKHQLQTYFNRRILTTAQRLGKTMIGWDEILGPDLPRPIVIESWRGPKGVLEAVRTGHPALRAHGYYLDLNQSAAAHYAADPLQGVPDSLAPGVLGGEAEMWTEFADSDLVDSRLWPRAAAVAERLWSPAGTRDAADLYRRLALVSAQLDGLGLRHRKAPEALLKQLAGSYDPAPLRTLAAVLEPVKDYKRHFQGFKYSTQTPLNRLVDAAPAESDLARRFASTVDSLLAAGSPLPRDKTTRRQVQALRQQLQLWQANDARLQPLLATSPGLREYAPLSASLSALSTVLLARLTQLERGQAPPAAWLASARPVLEAAQAPTGQAELAIAKAARKLVGLP